MLQRLRERLVLILIAALPFHALFVTAGTKLAFGPGHAPWTALALWKEALLAVICGVGVVEILKDTSRGSLRSFIAHVDLIDVLIAAFGISALVISLSLSTLFTGLLGAKYVLLPLIAFLILRRVPWSEAFGSRVIAVLMIVGSLVAAYGVFALFAPQAWFTWLGYGDLHSLYLPGGPLAPFQQIEGIGIRRMQSAFSGPNQMGLWMLMAWSAALITRWKIADGKLQMGKREDVQSAIGKLRSPQWLFLLPPGLAIALSFSRSAWIAAAVIALIAWWSVRSVSRKQVLVYGLAGLLFVAVGIAMVPEIALRATSSSAHIERPLQALRIILDHPLGLGLGAAGPASNRVSDACVHLPPGSDASWAADRPDLCVFVGGTQIQPVRSGHGPGEPVGRACRCPVLPENWFLQIGVETGFAGMAMFVALIVLMLKKLHVSMFVLRASTLAPVAFLSLLGISIAGFFLHSFEDSAVALTAWILAAAALAYPPARGRDDPWVGVQISEK